jgi:hypothetical protein
MADRENNSEIQVTEVNKNPDAPLVVDLPDGQKLMVGQLPPGTVVEIATWRGTSRPDSRTTRLLLGVSSVANDEQEEEVKVVPVEKVSRRARRNKRRFLPSLQGLVLTAVTVGVLVGAFILSPLQLIHPTLGSSIGFGSAESSLIVTLPIENPSVGTPVLAYLGDDKSAVVFGTFSQSAQDTVLIQTSSGFAQTKESNVIGRSLLVIPFIGKLF